MEPDPRTPGRPRPKRRRPAARHGWNPVVVGAAAAGVLLVAVAVVWAAVHFAKARRGDPRLIGTWQSDADATIAELRKSRPITDQQEQKLRQLFGKLKLTYTAKTITSELDGTTEAHPYQVVRKEGDWILIKCWWEPLKQDVEERIRFDGNDTYWVEVPQISAVIECFRRVR